MANHDPQRRDVTVVATIQNLSEGIQRLVRQRLELFRVEVQQDLEAIDGLREGIDQLVRQHLELFRHEIRQELSATGRRASRLAGASIVAATFLLFGYGLLNLSVILYSLHTAGTRGGFISALVLTALNLAVGAAALWKIYRDRKSLERVELDRSRYEWSRSQQWLKQLPNLEETSPDEMLPGETTEASAPTSSPPDETAG
jgi:uncharacterized membrane protein YqjE